MPRDKSSLALLCRRAAVRTIGRSKELVAVDNIVGSLFLWDRHAMMGDAVTVDTAKQPNRTT